MDEEMYYLGVWGYEYEAPCNLAVVGALALTHDGDLLDMLSTGACEVLGVQPGLTYNRSEDPGWRKFTDPGDVEAFFAGRDGWTLHRLARGNDGD